MSKAVGVVGSWGSLAVSFLPHINEWLQLIVLLLGGFVSLLAIIDWFRKRNR